MSTGRNPLALLASVREAATALGCSEDKIRRLMRDGDLPQVRIRGSVRTTWAAVDAIATPVPALGA